MAHDDATRGLQRAGEAPVGQAAASPRSERSQACLP